MKYQVILLLDLTKSDFESCFPGCDIKVECRGGRLPFVTKKYRGKVTRVKYTKRLASECSYENLVEVEKHLSNGKVIISTSSFDMPTHFALR